MLNTVAANTVGERDRRRRRMTTIGDRHGMK